MLPILQISRCLLQTLDIDFTATTSKKNQKDVASSSSLNKQKRHIEPPSTSELDVFYKTLNHAQLKPAILKITPPYLDQYIPDSCNANFPDLISHVYNPNCLSMDYMLYILLYIIILYVIYIIYCIYIICYIGLATHTLNKMVCNTRNKVIISIQLVLAVLFLTWSLHSFYNYILIPLLSSLQPLVTNVVCLNVTLVVTAQFK